MLITSLDYPKKSEIFRGHNNMTKVGNFKIASTRSLLPKTLPLNQLQKSKNISFSSNPLYNIHLKKLMPNGKYDFITASFSQLVKKDEKDEECILKLKKAWAENTKYGAYISNDFLKDNSSKESYFVTEIMDSKMEPYEKVTCIMETTNPGKSKSRGFFNVNFMQASPEIANIKKPKFKGSGELSLYCIAQMAKKFGYEKIRVVSFNDNFYKKMGFKRKLGYKRIGKYDIKVLFYELPSSNFDSFIKRVSKKYHLN